MKTLAIALNTLALIGLLILAIDLGDTEDFIIPLAISIVPIINIAALLKTSDSWLALYFARLRLEEQQKIQKLTQSPTMSQPRP